MKPQLIPTLIIALMIVACSTEPQAINFGKDLCVHCSMTIMDKKFGAELINPKGKALKFDSGECMVNYLKTENKFDANQFLIVDYNSDGTLINVSDAVFVKGGNVNSPMGGNLAAFKSKEDAEQANTKFGGDLMNWDEIKNLDF